jgi:cytochrome c
VHVKTAISASLIFLSAVQEKCARIQRCCEQDVLQCSVTPRRIVPVMESEKQEKTPKPIYRACYWVGDGEGATRSAREKRTVKKLNRKEREMRGVIFAALLAITSISGARAQDAAAGEKVFAVCKACHQIGETAKNAVGPVLNGVIGRPAGTYPGFNYTDANKNSGLTWDEATFRDYIKDPRAKIPGTKMIYPGLKDEQKTSDLLAFLKQFDADGKKK